MARGARISATAVAVTLAGAGCGGGGGGGSSQGSSAPPKAPTKAQYVSRVNAICKRANREEAGVKREVRQSLQGSGNDPRKVSAGLGRFEGFARRVDAQIKAVPPPSGPEGEGARRYVASIDRQIALIGQARQAIERKDATGAQMAFQKLAVGGQASQEIAKEYGLTECAKP